MKFEKPEWFRKRIPKIGEFNNRQKMSGLSGLCRANVGIVGILFHQNILRSPALLIPF